jgi:hypothetical protein
MQPVDKKYNASDVASGFSHEYSIGIHKTGPRPIVDVFDVAAQVGMHAHFRCKNS